VIDADHTRTEQRQTAIATPTAGPSPSSASASPTEKSPSDVPPDAAVSDASTTDVAREAGPAAPTATVSVSPVALTNSVMLISVDGLAARFVDAEITAGSAPTFARLQREGSWTLNARCEARISVTLPNHTSMITGRPAVTVPDLPAETNHGYLENFDPGDSTTLHNRGNPNLAYVTSIFDEVHDRGGFTALYAGKSKFLLFRRSYAAPASRVDLLGPDDGRNKIDSFDVLEDTSALVSEFMEAVETGVGAHPDGPNFTMLHIRDTDSAGHAYGWGTDPYIQALELADYLIGGVLDAIATSEPLRNTVVIVTTDHGGIDLGHYNTALHEVVDIPFFVWGKGIPRGRDLYSVSQGRKDPKDEIPMDAIANQPIRNGDAGNLALSLMGLPAIEGSLHQGLSLEVEAPGADDAGTGE